VNKDPTDSTKQICPVLLIIQAAQKHTVSHKLSSTADHTDSTNTYCLTQTVQYCNTYRQHKHILSHTNCPILQHIQAAQTHTVSHKLSNTAAHTDSTNTYSLTQSVQYCWSYRQHKHILSHTNCPVLLILKTAQTHTVSHKLSNTTAHTDSTNTYCLTQTVQYYSTYRQHKHILSHTNCPILQHIQTAQTHTVSHKLSSTADHTGSTKNILSHTMWPVLLIIQTAQTHTVSHEVSLTAVPFQPK